MHFQISPITLLPNPSLFSLNNIMKTTKLTQFGVLKRVELSPLLLLSPSLPHLTIYFFCLFPHIKNSKQHFNMV